MSARFERQDEPIPGYRLIERIGSGGFGEVWKCEAPGGIFKAVKIIHGDLTSKDTDTNRFAEQELKALKRVKQVRHPYLLTLDRFDIVNGRLMIVMELADCNLWDRFRDCRNQGLPGIPRDELLRLMNEAAEVLDLMNDQFQLQHLDIKPQNLFLLYNHVKVADFGQVKDLEGMVASVTGGITPVYAAPETFDGVVSRYCDQYSLACVYQELLTGQRPFDGTSMQQLLMQHLQHPPNLAPSPIADRPALAKALAKKPDDRFPSCSAMVRAIAEGLPETVSTSRPRASGPPSSAVLSGSERIEVFLTNRTQGKSPTAAAPQVAVAKSKSPTVPPSPPKPPAPGKLYPPKPPAGLPPLRTSSGSLGWPGARQSGTSEVLSTNLPPLVPPGGAGPGSYVPIGEVTPPPRSGSGLDPSLPPERPAPAEQLGPGCLRPAVVIGIGYTGLRVLQRLTRELIDRYGPSTKRPMVQTLFIDTDPDTIAGATKSRPDGRAALPEDEVYGAKLNRAGHYLKPRLNGRTLLEGWFDQQQLYRLPRTPTTMGIRAFGRLAFFDHYRGIMAKLQADLDTCLASTAFLETHDATNQDLRTNRPRVYVVAGLGGGTGSGMFLDVAYAVRARLKRLGYAAPDVAGVLLAPPEGYVGEMDPQAMANTYAALTELHHFSRPDTTFTAHFDDRGATVADPDPPFTATYILPGLPAVPRANAGGSASEATGIRTTAAMGSAARATPPRIRPNAQTPGGIGMPPGRDDGNSPDPCTAAADLIRLDLFSLLGRVADEARGQSPPRPSHARAAGMTRFRWPRGEVVTRAVKAVCHDAMVRWTSPDPARVRQVIPGWAVERWNRLGLDPERLVNHLKSAAEETTGCPVANLIASAVDPLVPKGWLARLPEPERVSVTLSNLEAVLGRPNPPGNPPPSAVQAAVMAAARELAKTAVAEATQQFLELVEDPRFRPAGAEEGVRQFLAVLDRTRLGFEEKTKVILSEATYAFQQLSGYINWQKGMRKPNAAELSDALKAYPKAQYQAVVFQGVGYLYTAIREPLIQVLNQIANCRATVEALVPLFPPPDPNASPVPLGPRDMLPVGCSTVESAAERFVAVLTEEDIIATEQRIQAGLVKAFGGLFQACLNQTDGPIPVGRVVREEARAYLNERLGDVDLAGMLWRHLGSPSDAAQGIALAFQEAEPRAVGIGPWARQEIPLFGCPTGPGGDPVRETAAHVLPPSTLAAPTDDEIVVYREYPNVPLTALPQVGAAWSAAYKAAPDLQGCPPHARLDVDRWVDIDSV